MCDAHDSSSLAQTRDLISMNAQKPAIQRGHPIDHNHQIPGPCQEWRHGGTALLFFFSSDIRTKEHKNLCYGHPSLHSWASSCLPLPNVHQTSQACIYNIKLILIRTEKERTYSSSVLLQQKELRTQHRRCKHWSEQMYVKLAWTDIRALNEIFCSYVLLSLKVNTR